MEQQETSITTETFTPNPNIKLVLNGGKTTLDSATVPVEWHFSDELIAKKPRYIVICDHEMPIEKLKDKISYCGGYRTAFSVRDLAGYIQIHKPGSHHFIAIVFYDYNDGKGLSGLSRARQWISGKNGQYDYGIFYDCLKDDSMATWNAEVTAVEFEVPKELFAEKSETWFGTLTWKWVNRWFSHAPVDQCEYRKRKVFAFTAQPFLLFIGRLIAGIFCTFYSLVGALCLLFIGFQPSNIFKNLLHSWWNLNLFDLDLRNTNEWGYKNDWRKWTRKDRSRRKIPLFAVPALDVVALGAMAGLIFLVVHHTMMFLFLSLIAIYASVVAKIYSNVVKSREKKEEVKKEIMDFHLEYLKKNAGMSSVPASVDIRSIIPKVDNRTKLHLSFWAMKAKVCKPFAN